MTKSISDKVVLVTGASSGFGKELAAQLLRKGAKVAATFRKQDQADAFTASHADNALGVVMDITDTNAIESGVASVIERFGSIDILANNAGVGTVGAVEETSDAEARRIFDVNFFGALAVNRAVLPIMRAQKSGHIFQYSAIGGFIGYPGLGVYAAAKGATDIVGEAMAAEVKPLGIDVTVLTIGIFETEFAGSSIQHTDKTIEDYADTPAGKTKDMFSGLQGNQPNVPEKGATAIIALMEADEPPVHAALGGDAMGGMRKKMGDIEAELSTWEANAASTARDAEAA